MNVIKKADQTLKKDEIIILHHPECLEINQILQAIESNYKIVLGFKNDEVYKILYQDIYYIEVIEEHVLIYTKRDVFETKFKLYEIEQLDERFLRVHKSFVVNLRKLKHFKSYVNAKLIATLDNDDQIEVSRTYVKSLKERMKNFNEKLF